MNLLDSFQALSGAANLLKEVTGLFIVRPAGVAGGPGVSGFVFDVLAAEEMELTSDITDHFVENNLSVQDHIALRPERFTLKGYVGELSDILPPANASQLASALELARVAGFEPAFREGAIQVYEAISEAFKNTNEVIRQAQSLYSLFAQGSTSSSKQQDALSYFYSMWLTRQLCTVQTPWQIFKDMAIDTISAVQEEDTRIISSFKVTFKRVRVAGTATVAADANALGRAADMLTQISQKGKATGIPVSSARLAVDFGPKS